jgi:histidinol dehydrogenase
MKLLVNPEADELSMALKRPVKKLKNIKKTVKPILKNVKLKGDHALRRYTLEYDHVHIDSLVVQQSEFIAAEEVISKSLKSAINLAKANIEKFHLAQAQAPLEIETMPGVICRRKSVPIEKVGLYIPGGTAPLFSTVLMLAVPAKIAGCSELVLCTPPNKNGKIHPAILYSAKLVGIDKVIKVGGAQAIAALAYGTESVPQVYKIFGPGNQYVTAAKQIVSEKGVAIDLPAGPSEVAVFADETAIPEFVATDLLSQAEHGTDSQVVLITTKESVAIAINQKVEKHLKDLPRKKIAEAALQSSVFIVVDTVEKAIDILNEYAAEHLILSIKDAESVAEKIYNAGSIFLGNYSPESVGDYASGTNHTLPTNRAALAYSGVSLDSFVKKITYQQLTEKGIQNIGNSVEEMAEAEGLIAHKRAVSVRLKYLKKKNGNK